VSKSLDIMHLADAQASRDRGRKRLHQEGSTLVWRRAFLDRFGIYLEANEVTLRPYKDEESATESINVAGHVICFTTKRHSTVVDFEYMWLDEDGSDEAYENPTAADLLALLGRLA